ncbi:glycosyltransferase [Ktedonosporobacter rubrisoli]|uniref:Glycosyltransferase n=1 Tax=Ktedonosporobacter rubrisoli TaxID=2509675 RepID=A0A4P6K0M3_KTERU|nr:glycosyltransferase [Ktedonosporobacter rubrisoli]QBD81738.1 glycosyltransferase [Ktedonosporobacter rubrisoli]
MRILFVTPYVPSRIRVRPFHFIRFLSAFHEISLVSLLCDEYEAQLGDEVREYCATMDLIPLSKRAAYINCLRALPSSMPLRVAYYQSPAFAQRIREVIRERDIKVVHAELIKVVPGLHALLKEEDIAIIYDSVDCITSYLEQCHRAASNPLQKAFVWSELLKMRRYELNSIESFARVVISSERDRERLIALGGQSSAIQVIPNGVDTVYFSPLALAREPDSLVFCAKMDYYPNSQAILRFAQDVLPLIWATRPQVQLTIVGNNPPSAVRELSADPRITVTGYVPDIRVYLARAAVALAPLVVAAGIQNKVLEALAMATPLVATPGTCRALQVEHAKHLLIAEEGQAYAEAILTLLAQPQLARRLGLAGRQLVEQRYSWAFAAARLHELYREVAEVQRTDDLNTALAL